MITKLLGIMDLVTAIAFLLGNAFSWFPSGVILFFAGYLLIKGLLFLIFLDFASIIDIICGLIILISIWLPVSTILAIIVVIYLLQKAFFSIAS